MIFMETLERIRIITKTTINYGNIETILLWLSAVCVQSCGFLRSIYALLAINTYFFPLPIDFKLKLGQVFYSNFYILYDVYSF